MGGKWGKKWKTTLTEQTSFLFPLFAVFRSHLRCSSIKLAISTKKFNNASEKTSSGQCFKQHGARILRFRSPAKAH